MSHIDLERGRRASTVRGGGSSEEAEEDGSVCFSDEGSCNSQFYSTADGGGSYDDYSGSEILEGEGLESGRASFAAEFVDLESGEDRACLGDGEKDCRICHLSLVSSSPSCGVAIELGCSCKDELGAAHKNCAETWFKIKGNKTCEICNSVASNVVGPNDIEAVQQGTENIPSASSTAAPSTTESRACLNGHRFLNFLLACMVFAFVISWLFHFNIPS